MSFTPHYIASFEEDSGLFTYTEPFLAPEKAFPVLEDAYCWRNRVKRKPGYRLLGRLRRVLKLASIGNFSAAGAGDVSVNLFTAMSLLATEPNAQIEPGTAVTPIVIAIGAPISQTLTDTLGTGVLTIAGAGPITAASLVYSTGVLTMTFSGAIGVSAATFSGAYFPGLPTMGLRTQEVPAINAENLIAFDTKYAYSYDDGLKKFIELVSAAATTWNGTDANFFWSTNYYKDAIGPLFWATNTRMTGTRDPIRYYNTTTWTTFAPLVTAADTLYNAEVILPYKNRLLFMNTWEGTTVGTINGATNFNNRLRWSWVGTPLDATAFRTDIVGKGGFLDAPTSEAIISAEFIKDTLIVKFERSSWKIVYTGNEILPFVFQKINTELGSESKFSLVPFDDGVFSVGNYGVTTDDSVNVQRIDVQIPSTIFQMQNNADGIVRVHGVRDYANEMVYWSYTNSADKNTFPDRVLCLNYRNKSYSIFKDSFTCFGYYQAVTEKTWAELTDFTWAEWNTAWNSGQQQALFPSVIAGTQHGFVEVLMEHVGNDPSLYIKTANFAVTPAVFTIPNHNLQTGDIIKIDGIIGSGVLNPSGLNGLTYRVDKVTIGTINVKWFDVTQGKFFDLTDPLGTGGPKVSATSVYNGNGMVTKLNNFKISTKRFTPFYEQGAQCRLGYLDFLLDKTTLGELTSNVFIDEDSTTSVNDADANTALLGSNVLYTKPDNLLMIPFQATQEKIFHRQYIQAVAQNIQVTLSMTPVQNATLDIYNSDFVMHALVLYLSPNARLIQ
jgi:hypothetical protein